MAMSLLGTFETRCLTLEGSAYGLRQNWTITTHDQASRRGDRISSYMAAAQGQAAFMPPHRVKLGRVVRRALFRSALPRLAMPGYAQHHAL